MLTPSEFTVTLRDKKISYDLTDVEPAPKRRRTEETSGRASHEDYGSVKAASIHIVETSPKETRWNTLIMSPQSSGSPCASSTRKPRVRKSDLGKLARILYLPLEIFREIATHLYPLDLLHLSRTNSDLRSYLISKSSRQIWSACEKAVDLPPCPVEFCEPRYANLCFEKECHACGCLKRVKRFDALRIRLCEDCKKLNLLPGKQLAEEVFGSEVSNIQEIYSLLPCTTANGYFSTLMLFGTLQPTERFFLRFDFINTVRRYLDLQPDSEERRDFVKNQHQLVEQIGKNIRDISDWESTRRSAESMIKEAIQTERSDHIKEKLRSLGYCSWEISLMSFRSHGRRDIMKTWVRLVNQPRRLTERSWKSLQPRLESLLQEKRRIEYDSIVKQNRDSRISDLQEWYKHFIHCTWKRPLPVTLCLSDLLKIPGVEEIIKEDGFSIRLTLGRMEPIEKELPKLIDDHFVTVANDCSRLLAFAQQKARTPDNDHQAPVPDSDIDPNNIWKASAFFGSFRGPHLLSTFSDVLSLRRRNLFMKPEEWEAWDSTKITTDLLIIRAANALLASLGIPENTDMTQMEQAGRSFVCGQCERGSRTRMSWKFLVGHLCDEIRKYGKLVDIFRANKLPFIESHKLEADDTPLAFFDPDFVEDQILLK